MTQGLILAAGSGTRLNGSNGNRPKCLVELGGGRTLIEYQVDRLESLGVERTAVVVGHCEEMIREVLGDRVEYIRNPEYATTNSLYSLWLADRWVVGSFILMNGDVLAHPAIFDRLTGATGSALIYDSTSGSEDEHMKVATSGRCLTSIGKDLPTETTCGENVGLLLFGALAAGRLFREADHLIADGAHNAWAPAAVGRLATSIDIECIDIAGLDWVEIDFPDDLRTAREKVWPQIDVALGARA